MGDDDPVCVDASDTLFDVDIDDLLIDCCVYHASVNHDDY